MITLDLPARTVPRPQPRKRSASAFTGAQFGRLTGDWVARRQSPSREVQFELATLRFRARERERNDPMVARYFKLLEKNVIGPKGMGLRVLGRKRNGELDRDTNRHIQEEFKLWSRRGMCDASGFFSFVGLQAMGIRTAARDGECFLQHLDGWNNPWGYALHALDADQFEESFQGVGPTGGVILASVERNEWNRPIAFHAWTAHPDDYFTKRTRERLPADVILHAYRPRRAGAMRGEPWITPVLKGIHDIERATEAVVVNLRVSAAKMGFIIPAADDSGEDDDQVNDFAPMEADPGMIDRLNAGETFEGFDPSFPVGEFIDLKRSAQHDCASALDISDHSLSGDLSGVNYTSSRTGLLDERDGYRQLHGWFTDHFLQPIYERWLRQAVLMGRVKVPYGDLTPYLETRWKPRGWQWVDPQKEVLAKALEKAFVFTSNSRIVDEDGEDYEETLEEQQADRKLEEQYGVTPATPSIVISIGGSNDGTSGDEGSTDGSASAAGANGRRNRPRLAVQAGGR